VNKRNHTKLNERNGHKSMSYCVNCGVELASAEKKCPLCGVAVINPAASVPELPVSKSYPTRMEMISRKIDRKYFASLASILLMIPLLITVIVDLITGGGLSWSLYVIGALFLLFVCGALPFFFPKNRFFLFMTFDGLVLMGYVFLIAFISGGDWFLPLGLPISGSVVLLALGLTTLFCGKKHRVAGLSKLAAVLFASGLLTVSIELILDAYLKGPIIPKWSLYAFVPCVFLGLCAAVLQHRRNFKEQIKKRLFF